MKKVLGFILFITAFFTGFVTAQSTDTLSGKKMRLAMWQKMEAAPKMTIKLLSTPTKYIFIGNGFWSDSLNWEDRKKPPATLPANDTIYINTQAGDSCILDTEQYLGEGSVFRIGEQSHLIITGDIQLPPIGTFDSSFTDLRDGQQYTYKTYGSDVWMTRNLNFYVPQSKLINNDTATGPVYGRLYNWYQAKEAVPAGWHLPTKAECDRLRAIFPDRLDVMDTITWTCLQPRNTSGFSARSAGYYYLNTQNSQGSRTEWWSDYEPIPGLIRKFGINCNAPESWTLANYGKTNNYFSVRCVKNLVDTPPPPPPAYDTTFTDPRDGKVYPVKRYNNQIWMTMNLNYKTSKSRYYNDDSTNSVALGQLYSWTDAQVAIPQGWHLPSTFEWDALYDYLNYLSPGSIKDSLYWEAPNTGGTNLSGFSARPGGVKDYLDFRDLGQIGIWWTSTEISSMGTKNMAIFKALFHDSPSQYSGEQEKGFLFSIRCIKD